MIIEHGRPARGGNRMTLMAVGDVPTADRVKSAAINAGLGSLVAWGLGLPFALLWGGGVAYLLDKK